MNASLSGATLEIPPWYGWGSNLGPLSGLGTMHSAPGNVVNFMIDHPSKIFNQMNVMWNVPPIRERNSVIMKYVISHNISGTMESLDVQANAEVSFMEILNVTAEKSYEVEVYAVNKQNQNGSIINEIYYAKPGPPRPPPVYAVKNTSAPTIIFVRQLTANLELVRTRGIRLSN